MSLFFEGKAGDELDSETFDRLLPFVGQLKILQIGDTKTLPSDARQVVFQFLHKIVTNNQLNLQWLFLGALTEDIDEGP